MNQIQRLYEVVNRYENEQALKRLAKKNKQKLEEEDEILETEQDEEDEELQKQKEEEVKYAKFNLSVLDPEIEK